MLAFLGQRAQGADEGSARLPGIDDLVDIAALGGRVRRAVAGLVLVFEVGTQTLALAVVGNSDETAAVENGDGARRAHHRDLGARPRAAVVVPERLAVHDDVGPAV